jgi:hypothetical protein
MKDALGHGSNPGTHAQGTAATPKLQRRHFEAIAAELKAKGASPDEVKAMAAKLATTNPGFRADFFVAAATGGKYNFKGPGKNGAAVARTAKRAMTPVQSENAPFKSRLGKSAGHSYLDPHDPRARK